MRTGCLVLILLALTADARLACAKSAKVDGPPGPYLVLVEPGPENEFLPAAEAMAALHGATLRRFNPRKLEDTLVELPRRRRGSWCSCFLPRRST